MASTIKTHPVYGAFIVSSGAAKIVSNDRWFINKLSELELEKSILNSGRKMDPTSSRKLTRLVTINQLEVAGVRALSRSFFPLLIGVTAIYLDHKIVNKE